ncbi:MAG TPA: hypothetical protein PLV92_23585, partial [Pirellulaceae bacterium]|nr:hypothetical protein [Pirellulaceae bacterium]
MAPPSEGPPTAATLRIVDVPEVTWKGWTIQGEGLRAAVSIEGRSQGCKLEGVKCSVLGAGGPSAMILLRPTGFAPDDAPVVIRGCVIESSPGAAGVRVLTDSGAGAVDLHSCVVRNGTIGVHVVADVTAPPGRLKIEHCELSGMQTGVQLEWAAPPPAGGFQLLNNTVAASGSWLQIAPTPEWPKPAPGQPPPQSLGVIVNNLAIGGAGKLPVGWQGFGDAAPFAAKSNWRAPNGTPPPADAGSGAPAASVAGWETIKSLEELRLWSVDPADSRYLRPAFDSPLLDSGTGGEYPKFIGAAASRLITVAQSGDADYRTIREALDAGEPEAVIRVLDDATYDEGVTLTEASKSAGITIHSVAGARWIAPEPRNLVAISSVPRVTILGFKMEMKRAQHGIRYAGRCAGCRVEQIQFTQPPDSNRSFIVLESGARGLPGDPIVISRIEGIVGETGIVLSGDQGAPTGGLR